MKASFLLLVGCWLFSGCANSPQTNQHAVTVQTGHPVVDAASHLATGLYLEKQAPARPVAANDPQVKALNDAIERAKSRQLMQQAAQPSVSQQDDEHQ